VNARVEVWFLSDDRVSVFVETDQETGVIYLRELLEITTVAAITAGVIANLVENPRPRRARERRGTPARLRAR